MRLGVVRLLGPLAALVVLTGLGPVDTADLRGHGGPIRAIVLSGDGAHALTASFDYSAIYWDLGGSGPTVRHRLLGHEAAVNAVAFTRQGNRAVTGSDDGTVAIWNLETGSMVHRFEGHKGKVASVAVSPDGRWAVSGAWDRTIRLWDLDSMAAGPEFRGHTGNVNAVLFTPEGNRIVSGSHDGTIRLWSVPGGDEQVIVRHGWGVNTLRLLPGNRLLYGALDGAVEVVDAASGETIQAFHPGEGPVLASAISADGSLVVVSGADGRIRIWAVDGWRPIHTHVNPYGPVWAVALSADSRALYYAGLDDFAIHLQIDPLAPFEPAKGAFPRRFQATEGMELGERMFAGRCSVCHTLTPEDANRAGPTLYHLFGRKAGSVSGYPYSDALRNSKIVWNEQTIGRLFEIGPQHFTPGTKMPLQAITSPMERAALIAYLKRSTVGNVGQGTGSNNQ